MLKSSSQSSRLSSDSDADRPNKNFRKQKLYKDLQGSSEKKENQPAILNKGEASRTKTKIPGTPSKAFLHSTKKQLTVSSKKISVFLDTIELCPICLQPLSEPIAKTECGHKFCFLCINASVESTNKCPCCRAKFNYITKGQEKIQVKQPKTQETQLYEDDYIEQPCYFCGTLDNVPALVLCDRCVNYCVHVYCDPEMRGRMPMDEWICAFCRIEEMRERELQSRQQRAGQGRTRRLR